MDKKKNENRFFALVGSLIAIGILILAIYSPRPQEDTIKVEGIVKSVSLANGTVSIVTPEKSDISVSVMPGTVIRDDSPVALTLPDLGPGMTLEIHAYPVDEHTVTAKTINVIDAPGIVILSPEHQGTIGNPAIVSGLARAFEGTVHVRVEDENGRILGETFTTAASEQDAFLYRAFEAKVTYTAPTSTVSGRVVAYEISAENGTEINKTITPIQFSNTETTRVLNYYSNRQEDPGALDCGVVYTVERVVEYSDDPIQAALEALLAGPTDPESQAGFFSNIPMNVRINSIINQKGIVTVDFSKELNQGGGSCHVTATRAQIERTVRQFPNVKTVQITVEGDGDNVLQP